MKVTREIVGGGPMLEIALNLLECVAGNQQIDSHSHFHSPAFGEGTRGLEGGASEATLAGDRLARLPARGAFDCLAG